MSPKAPREIKKIGWVFNHISARYPKINPAAIIEVITEPTPINNRPGPLVLFMLLSYKVSKFADKTSRKLGRKVYPPPGHSASGREAFRYIFDSHGR
jgi:hypothetical protein